VEKRPVDKDQAPTHVHLEFLSQVLTDLLFSSPTNTEIRRRSAICLLCFVANMPESVKMELDARIPPLLLRNLNASGNAVVVAKFKVTSRQFAIAVGASTGQTCVGCWLRHWCCLCVGLLVCSDQVCEKMPYAFTVQHLTTVLSSPLSSTNAEAVSYACETLATYAEGCFLEKAAMVWCQPLMKAALLKLFSSTKPVYKPVHNHLLSSIVSSVTTIIECTIETPELLRQALPVWFATIVDTIKCQKHPSFIKDHPVALISLKLIGLRAVRAFLEDTTLPGSAYVVVATVTTRQESWSCLTRTVLPCLVCRDFRGKAVHLLLRSNQLKLVGSVKWPTIRREMQAWQADGAVARDYNALFRPTVEDFRRMNRCGGCGGGVRCHWQATGSCNECRVSTGLLLLVHWMQTVPSKFVVLLSWRPSFIAPSHLTKRIVSVWSPFCTRWWNGRNGKLPLGSSKRLTRSTSTGHCQGLCMDCMVPGESTRGCLFSEPRECLNGLTLPPACQSSTASSDPQTTPYETVVVMFLPLLRQWRRPLCKVGD